MLTHPTLDQLVAMRRNKWARSPECAVTQPDAAQAALVDHLGIVLPKRMRLAASEWQTLAATA